MKITFVCTVLNEEENITQLLDSILIQSKLPDEIIFVDGGSTDNTMSIISNFEFSINKKYVKIFQKKGNRSIGRNYAIKQATGDIILCSDAGCFLDKNWIKNITDPFKNNKVEVVAGYYKGVADTLFYECLIPYVLVMPDKINYGKFLPSARSMAFKKLIWKNVLGFDENLSDNEDYAFSNKLQEIGVNIFFAKKAIVYWIPRKNLTEAFIMFYRFASGDMYAKIIRPKVLFIFVRYFLGILIVVSGIISKDRLQLAIILCAAFLYILWSIVKNYKYVNKIQAIAILPVVQIVSDIAVMLGSLNGIFRLWSIKHK